MKKKNIEVVQEQPKAAPRRRIVRRSIVTIDPFMIQIPEQRPTILQPVVLPVVIPTFKQEVMSASAPNLIGSMFQQQAAPRYSGQMYETKSFDADINTYRRKR